MPMFRKRPVTVEARPWDSPDAAYGLIEWAGEDVLSYDESASGPPGEFYFCKPDVFEATYEPADEVR